MKYIYTNEKGDKSECGLERWAWGVVYKSTDEQIKEAKDLTIQRNKDLVIERNQKLKDAREMGGPDTNLEMISDFYKHEMEKEVIPLKDELKQFGDDGVFHRFAEIKQDEVEIFTMYRTDDEEMLKRIDMKVSEGAQIFHFYRQIGLDYQSKENFRKIQIYVFGWKRDGACSYNYILPDDRIVTADHDISNLLEFSI